MPEDIQALQALWKVPDGEPDTRLWLGSVRLSCACTQPDREEKQKRICHCYFAMNPL